MALSDPYATIADYNLAYGRNLSTDDVLLTAALVACSRFIDRSLGRTVGFQKDGSAVARIFLPRGRYRTGMIEEPWAGTRFGKTLDIDDLVSVTAIVVDENRDNTFSLTLAGADYELLPRNTLVQAEVQPYRQVGLTAWGSRSSWTADARVKVTGIWGWPAVPSAIRAATLELAALLRLETPRATSAINEVNQVLTTSRAAQGIVADLLDAYRDPRLLVGSVW